MKMELIQPFINAADAVLSQGLQGTTKVGNLTMEEDAYRRKGVAVRPRAVARIEHREGRDQVRGRHRLAAERRIDQDQGAALDVVDRHL